MSNALRWPLVTWAIIPRGRAGQILATVAVATVAVGGAALIPGVVTDSSSPGGANLWVDTNGGTCTRSSSAMEYSDAAACATFDAAYQAASSGDTVLVRAGTYSFQTINVASPNKTSTVVIQAVEGATVDVAGARINGADYVTLQDLVNTQSQSPFSMNDDGAGNDPDNNTFKDLQGPWFDILGGSNNTVSGGDYGDCVADASNSCTGRLTGDGQMIDGVTIHNITSSNETVFHPDGTFVRGCTSCVIRNSTYYNNQITNIRIQNCCGLSNNNGLEIYNNQFGFEFQNWSAGSGFSAPGWSGIQNDTETPSLVIAFNSFASTCTEGSIRCGSGIRCTGDDSGGKTGSNCGTSSSPALIYGNLTAINSITSCVGNSTQSYNVRRKYNIGTTLCGATEVLVTTQFPYTTEPPSAGDGAIDFTVTGSTWSGDEMVSSALCSNYPTDINGASRTTGVCDAGAFER